jgi:hypothetical protein
MECGYLTASQHRTLCARASQRQLRLGRYFVEQGILTEEQLAEQLRAMRLHNCVSSGGLRAVVDNAMPNNRRAQRVHFFSGGELRQGPHVAMVTVVDISLGGVLVGLPDGSDDWQLDAEATVNVRLNDSGLEMVFDGVYPARRTVAVGC